MSLWSCLKRVDSNIFWQLIAKDFVAENLYLCSNVWKALRLLCTFRSIILFKSGLLSQNIGRGVIFNLKKKLLKKTKFWRRNRSFTFTPEVKVYPLIDSPLDDVMQSTETTFAGLELATELISHHVSIFRGVIIGMNKPGPGHVRGPVRRSERSEPKMKIQQLNEQTSESWRKIEATAMGSNLQKIESRVDWKALLW